VLTANIDLGDDLPAAMARPRFHHQWSPATLRIEDTVPAAVQKDLKSRGHELVVHKPAGATNAILRRPDGSLYGDMFDGIGFTRAAKRIGFDFAGADCLIVGAGGVGSAIAAAIAAEGAGSIALFDVREAAAEGLAARLQRHYPGVPVRLGGNDPAGYRLVVNATPLGMAAGDPLPLAPDRLDPGALVGDVVLGAGVTRLLQEAARRGCRTLVGTDMLFEQIPAYLEFFGYGSASTDELRALAKIRY